MTQEQAAQLFSRSLKARTKSENPEAVNCPAFTRAVEKALDTVTGDLFFHSLATNLSHCIEYLQMPFSRLTQLEQVMVSGKTRDQWLAMFSSEM